MFKAHSYDWKREISKQKSCFLIVFGMLFKNPWSKLSLVQSEIQYGAKFGEKYKENWFFFIIFFRAERVLGIDPWLWSTVIVIVELQEKNSLTDLKYLRKMADIQYVGHAILETTRFPRNSVLKSFWGSWLWIWHRIFGIQNGGPNMADIIFWKLNDFRGTFCSRAFGVADYEFDTGFPFFDMANMKFGKLYDFRTTLNSGVFWVADYEF